MICADLIQAASILPTDISALESSISALERCISALESEIKTFESSLPWPYWVYVFSFLVAVGVAMELWIIRHDWRDEMAEWALGHFGVMRLPPRPSPFKLCVEIWSVLLIVVGVMGEAGVGIGVARIDVRIRDKSAELRSKNAKLRNASDRLIALLHEETESERNARVKLQASMEWRKFTPEQGRKLCSQLGPRLARRYLVKASEYDMETDAYASGIADALDRCEQLGKFPPIPHRPPRMSHVSAWGPHEIPLFGVWITYDIARPSPNWTGHETIHGKQEAVALRAQLEASGVVVVGIKKQFERIPWGVIYVGPRPPPSPAYLSVPVASPQSGGVAP